MKRAFFSLLLVLGFVTACSHTHQFRQLDSGAGNPSNALARKTVSYDLQAVPEAYSAQANGHSYQLTGVRSQVASALRADYFPRVSNDAELQVRVSVRLDLRAAAMGTKCSVTTRTEILQNNRALATGSGEHVAKFPGTSNAGRNCEVANLAALVQSVDDALRGLRTSGAPKR